ncbi:hypothetical protein JT327_gp22 [Aeromonas phage LAh_7]|uniref:Uncharacterized protein n=1 Tax=Aeromonas phage LAh_7 TaxID=2591031 RepID=A0A514A0F8_9CAUD|nr:hypothetical protein JT327_gp22 [Aeromonas phage LAh_7]QDH46715.1 hypothetical protein LAh7_22 [Aeromonas phage LAh_7]
MILKHVDPVVKQFSVSHLSRVVAKCVQWPPREGRTLSQAFGPTPVGLFYRGKSCLDGAV